MGYLQMSRNVESIFGAVVTAPHQIPYTYTATGGETFISLPFYPVTGFITINGGVQVPVDNYEIDGNTVNLGRALEADDVVYCLFDKILSPEDYENGIRIYKFQAVGNEILFTPDFTTYGVQSLYIDGKFQVPGVDYTYNSTTGVVSFLTGSPAAGVWVVAEMSIKQNYLALSSDGGASLIGTTSGKTVQEELNSVDNDLVKLKLNWAIENGYADSGLTFTTGGTLTTNDRNKVVYDPDSKTWYSYVGTLPVSVSAGSNPVGDANWTPQTDPTLRAELDSGYLDKFYTHTYDTVASMRSGTHTVGDRVRWLGYYTAGDGGGNTGVVISGNYTEDGGKYFLLNNGLFVSAYILTAIDPLQFGLSVNNTAAQNTAAINAAATFCGTYKIPLIHKRGGTYKISPITLDGTNWDWFWWECPRGLVTLDCDHESLPAIVVRGTQTSNTESNFMNSFQYCHIIGFRIRSPYIGLRFLYTERCLFQGLVISGKARASDGVNSSIGFYGPNDLRETSSLDTIADCVVANCNQAFKSGVNTQAELGTKNIVLGDFTIRNTLFTDCGYIEGTYVADFGYIDGATFDTLQISMIGAVAYTTRVHAMRCYKPQLLNMTNCNIWESNGIGLHLLSPRNTCIDASNTIWGSGAGAGAADSDPAILITTYDNVPSTDVQLSPIVGESWGSVVKIVGQNGIDLSGLKEHNNCKYQTTPGIHLQNCTGTRMFNAQMASTGTHIARVDNADFEIQNLKYSGYTAQFDNLNNGTVNVVPGLRVRQVTSATIAGGLDDEIQYNAASGGAIVTLPAANRFPGKLIRIIKTDASANGVGVFPASGSGQTINGAASYSLTTQFSYVQLRSTGENWIIVGKS